MRALSVSIRLAATVMAVAAATGCVRVGNEGTRPAPSHSAEQRIGAGPDGEEAVTDGGGAAYQGGQGKTGAPPGRDASAASASASPSASRTAKPSAEATAKDGKGGGQEDKPQKPEPPLGEPTPTPGQQPPPTKEPVPPTPDPSTPEPSSSAHEPSAQLVERAPARRAQGRP